MMVRKWRYLGNYCSLPTIGTLDRCSCGLEVVMERKGGIYGVRCECNGNIFGRSAADVMTEWNLYQRKKKGEKNG